MKFLFSQVNVMNQSLKHYVDLEDKIKLLRTDANTKQDYLFNFKKSTYHIGIFTKKSLDQ